MIFDEQDNPSHDFLCVIGPKQSEGFRFDISETKKFSGAKHIFLVVIFKVVSHCWQGQPRFKEKVMPIIIENWNGFRVEEHNGHIELYWRTSAAATINAETLWTSFAAAFPSYASHGSFHAVYGNAGNDVIERRTGGDVFAWGGNDTLNLYATNGTSQIHTWAGGGNDIVNMNFSNITAAYSHGHHNRGDDGNDAFNFVATNSVGANETIVGRLEDFDASRDSISINGALVNLSALPTNVKIVLHNGDHNDPGAEPQQWLVIKTSTGGYILYTLEGARVDMVGTNGGSNDGAQESHFLNSNGIAADEMVIPPQISGVQK